MAQKLDTFKAKKSLGQHFLNNPGVPKTMTDAAMVQKGDVVLEVGPGTGVLTRELLLHGAQVIAIETDSRAITVLAHTFSEEIASQRLTIIDADIRTVDLSALGLTPHAYKVVANIPYYISGMLFRMFLEHKIQPQCLVFLVQREVALRIARDKKESLLSLSVKVFGEAKYVQTVKRGNFTPQPKVDSAIVSVHDIGTARLKEAGITAEYFFYILHAGFKSKRKQLLGNLSGMMTREALTHIFSTLNLPLDVRGEDLSIQKWLTLCHALFIHRK